jgi:uncharacterized protein YcaQ
MSRRKVSPGLVAGVLFQCAANAEMLAPFDQINTKRRRMRRPFGFMRWRSLVSSQHD